jgi:hypothetical protein
VEELRAWHQFALKIRPHDESQSLCANEDLGYKNPDMEVSFSSKISELRPSFLQMIFEAKAPTNLLLLSVLPIPFKFYPPSRRNPSLIR